MKNKSAIIKAAGSAATAGALVLLFNRVKDRMGPKPMNVSVEMQTTDMKRLSYECRKQLNQKREECVKEISTKAERQSAALLLDCEESGIGLIEYLRPKAEILSSSASVSLFGKIVTFLFGPIISFIISLAATVLLISVKWKMEQSASPEISRMLNPVIIVSAVATLHLLLNIINTLVRYAPERSKELTVGVTLEIPGESMELFTQQQLERVKNDTAQIRRAYADPSKLDDPTLSLISEAYCDIYQAEKTDDMTDVFGFIMPKCAGALKKMEIEIVDTYSSETDHLFSTIEAPGYDKSMVIRPALLLKNGGYIVSKGEYVKGI